MTLVGHYRVTYRARSLRRGSATRDPLFASGVDATRAADIIWAILSLENYEALVVERGWTPDEYAVWVHGALRATLLKGR